MARGGGALHVERRDDGVVVLTLDVPGEPVNTLRRELADEFERAVAALRDGPPARALVLRSGKADGFVAGADLDALRATASSREAEALSRLLQAIASRIAALPLPTVAAIHGECLGGGLELALAFDARVASEHPRTLLGLPEVQLGLLPGGGGTQRLPRLVGIERALDMMLTGRRVGARAALDHGLVDALSAPDALLEVASALALRLAHGARARRAIVRARPAARLLGRVGLRHRLLCGTAFGRRLAFGRARARMLARTRGLYPAPERILDVVRVGLVDGFERGLDEEARAFGALAVSPESRQLVGLFFATRALKRDRGVDDPEVRERSVERITVVGAGLMGVGIAYVSAARAGVEVALRDRDADSARSGVARVRDLLERRVRRARMTADERDAVLARVRAVEGGDGLARVDLVVEAVFEDLDLKRRILRDVETGAAAQPIFATNTSSLPVSRIAEASATPENVIGMHYFSPVDRMPLLEVVVAPRTSPEVVATCVAFGKRQDKTVIVVRDGPGFFTSRILAPYLNEAVRMVGEGVAVEAIDDALLDFGFAVGPLALLDEIGLDVAGKVSAVMHEAFGDRMAPPPAVAGLAGESRLGRKNRRGFYRYGRDGVRAGADPDVYAALGVRPGAAPGGDAIAERCALQMINETVHCLEQGVVRSARDADVGAVFGLGFPPFRGGPLRYVDALGAGEVLARLAALERAHGLRFAPAPLLAQVAASGTALHGDAAAGPG